MTYKIRLEKEASKFYQKADKGLARKLNKCFEALEKNPYQHPNIKPLKGRFKGQYRYRIGNYRVIYEINSQVVEVVVLVIRHRGEAYNS